MKTVHQFAPAKINLTLHVKGRREDGFHLIESFVAFADVGDEITVKATMVLTSMSRAHLPVPCGQKKTTSLWKQPLLL